MEIVLVSVGNFQDYLLYNIENLLNYNNNNITVIIDEKYNENLKKYNNKIKIVFVESLNSKYNYNIHTKGFRNGFWYLSSLRFDIIYNYMKKFNISNILHIENDVLLFKNIDDIQFHNKNKILLTMDSENRCIPGILFIPNFILLQKCLKYFTKNNDMYSWANAFNNLPDIIDTLPICFKQSETNELNIVTRNFNKYNVIFDAAAIGQYIDGIDPRNNNSNTRGFVNETCVIKYDKYKFKFYDKKPYLIYGDKKIEIINLHIHSKNLKKFI